MYILIGALVLTAGVLGAALLLVRGRHPAGPPTTAAPPATTPPPPTRTEDERRERRAELPRFEERALSKQEAIDAKLADLARREQALADRERNVARDREKLDAAKSQHLRELERIAGLSASQAKQILIRE